MAERLTKSITVTQSSIKTWRRCQKKYYYQYILNLEPIKKKKYLDVGTFIHLLIDSEGDQKKIAEATDSEEINLSEEERKECISIYQNYTHHYRNDHLTIVETEFRFKVRITSGIYLSGWVDKVVQDANGALWIMDHKTGQRLLPEESRQTDIQLPLYYYAWNKLKPKTPVVGRVWDLIRSKTPTIPTLLKDGTISKRKDMDTTKEVYLKAIKENNLPVEEYKDFLKTLENKSEKFFRRVYIPPPTPSMMEKILEDVIETAKEIKHKKEKESVYTRNLTYECSTMCQFFDLCQLEIHDYDTDHIIKGVYKKKEDLK